jgi:hypothetical protein
LKLAEFFGVTRSFGAVAKQKRGLFGHRLGQVIRYDNGRILLQNKANGHRPGNCRQQDEGKSDVAEKSNVSGFILWGWQEHVVSSGLCFVVIRGLSHLPCTHLEAVIHQPFMFGPRHWAAAFRHETAAALLYCVRPPDLPHKIVFSAPFLA